MNVCSDVSLIRITVLVLIILFVFGLLTYSELFKISEVREDDTLIFAHVFFSNGDSAIKEHWNSFNPEIPARTTELTNNGKASMFDLGLELRRNYVRLIGKDYAENAIRLTSLNTNALKDGLLLTLAGLFPLRGSKIKPAGLYQNRILINLINSTDNLLRFSPGKSCPKFDQLYKQALAEEKYANLTKEYQQEFDFWRNLTNDKGIFESAFMLNYNIESGWKPPEELNRSYPHPIKRLSNVYTEILTWNDEMKKILTGRLLYKLTNDTIERLKNATETKLYLYSVEKYNLEYLVRTLGLLGVDEIEKASYISLEVHKFDGYLFIKVVFKKRSNKRPIVLELPYCGKICPLHYFIEMNRKYFPTENMCEK